MSRILRQPGQSTTLVQFVAQRAMLLAMFALSIALLIIGKVDDGFNHRVQSLVSDITTPVVSAVRAPIEWVANAGDMFADYTRSAEEMALLRQENERLQALAPEADRLASENRRLRALLALPNQIDLRSVTARMLRRRPSTSPSRR